MAEEENRDKDENREKPEENPILQRLSGDHWFETDRREICETQEEKKEK